MLTDIQEYLRLPLDSHPRTCPECERDLFSIGAVVLYKFWNHDQEIVLCPECAEKIGFYLWTDALRAKGAVNE